MNEHHQIDPAYWGSDGTTNPIMICLLGNFRLLNKDQLVPIRAGGKSEALLAYLGMQHGRRVPRERLVQVLWPDNDLTLSLNSLNNLVYHLTKLLGPALQDASPVLHQEGYYQLNIEAGIEVDVACFDALVKAGDRYSQAGNSAAAMDAYHQAVELYRDDLCLFDDPQTIVERERLRACYLTVLAQLADHYYHANDYRAALGYIWQLLGQDCCREDAHRLVMRCYVRRGERAAALRHYQVCVNLLRDQLDVEPEAATVALFEQIRLHPDQI
jgi:DNA-binding SARP family transcriptional activator